MRLEKQVVQVLPVLLGLYMHTEVMQNMSFPEGLRRVKMEIRLRIALSSRQRKGQLSLIIAVYSFRDVRKLRC